MLRPILLAPLAALALGGCTARGAEGVVPIATPSRVATAGWRGIATNADRERLRDWRKTFVAALDAARQAGHGAEIGAEGALLEPDASLGGPLPSGLYRCRTIKLGAKSAGFLDYVAYPAFTCRVQDERGMQGLAKLSGSQRPVGLILPESVNRQVLLGTLVLGDEPRAMQYGRDPDRDIAAWVERIGDKRWRLVVPEPRLESKLDVYELVPLPQGK